MLHCGKRGVVSSVAVSGSAVSSGVMRAGRGQYLSSGVWRRGRGGPTPVPSTELGAQGRVNGAEMIVIAHPRERAGLRYREHLCRPVVLRVGGVWGAAGGPAAMEGESAWGRARVGKHLGSHWLSPAWGSVVCALDVTVWVTGLLTLQGAGLLRHRKATAWCHWSHQTGCVLPALLPGF